MHTSFALLLTAATQAGAALPVEQMAQLKQMEQMNQTAFQAFPGQAFIDASTPRGFSAARLHSSAVKAIQAKGLSIKDRLPANLVKGPHQINPKMNVGLNPVAPTHNAVVLLLRFSDAAPSKVPLTPVPASAINDMLFGDAYNPYILPQFAAYASLNGVQASTFNTLKNYYKEVSYGKVTVGGAVVEVQMPKPLSYYKVGQPYGVVVNEYGDFTLAEMLRDAVAAADPQVDFSQYAINGVVPDLFVIHPGTGAEWNGDPSIIWSHSWNYTAAYHFSLFGQTGDESYLNPANYDPSAILIADGVAINNYSIEPEVGGDVIGALGAPTGPYPPNVGVYVHEFAHVLGLPDLYDYGYDAMGLGMLSPMATGNWAGFPVANQYGGNMPLHFDPWSKLHAGFATPKLITEGLQTVTLRPSSKYADFVKIVVPNSAGSEYFLIENRQPLAGAFDLSLSSLGASAKGLLVYHVDENVLARNFWRPNEGQNFFESRKQAAKPDPVTGETHYGVSLIQMDDRWDLEKNANEGDAGDFYKAGGVLSPNSTPNSGSYYCNAIIQGAVSNYTGVVVQDIVQNADGSVSFKAGFEAR